MRYYLAIFYENFDIVWKSFCGYIFFCFIASVSAAYWICDGIS
jgi:hypothetical protein